MKYKASSISSTGIICRDRGNFKATIYCLEKSLQQGSPEDALNLAKVYNVTGRQSKYVKKLLKTVLYGKGGVCEYSREQAAAYLKQMKRGHQKFKPYAVCHPWHKDHYQNAYETFKFSKKIIAKYAKAITQFEFDAPHAGIKRMRQLATRFAYPPAMDFLGYLYCQGIWVSRDIDKSVLWYQMALDAGYTDSLLNLAQLYRTTLAYDQYYDVLKEAVRLGYPKAQLLLVQLYDAVDRDKKQAKNLLKAVLKNEKATVNIVYEAQELLKQIDGQKT